MLKLHHLITKHIARRRLARDVERRKNSFEIEQFRRRREAALKFTRAGR